MTNDKIMLEQMFFSAVRPKLIVCIFWLWQIRLTNEKIAAVLVTVEHAKDAMLAMGFVEEGEFLVLPAGKNLTMAQVRDIEDAKQKLKKEMDQALMRAACPKKKETEEMKRVREQMEADKRERATRGPITQSSKATPKGQGGLGGIDHSEGGGG